MLELLLHLKDDGPSTPVSIVASRGISPKNVASPAVSTLPHSLPRGKDQAKLIRRRRRPIRLDASTTCSLRQLLKEHQLWRVCFSPMATPSLYSLILVHLILLSELFA